MQPLSREKQPKEQLQGKSIASKWPNPPHRTSHKYANRRGVCEVKIFQSCLLTWNTFCTEFCHVLIRWFFQMAEIGLLLTQGAPSCLQKGLERPPRTFDCLHKCQVCDQGGGASWGENVWVVLWSEIILHRASLCSDHLIFQDGITQPITHKQHMRLGVPLPKCLGNTWLNFWPSPQGLNFVTWCGDGIGLGSHQQKIVESFLSTWSTLCTGFHCILTILLSRWQKSACNSQTVHIRPVYTCQKCLERPNWTFGCLHNGKVLSHK